MPELKLFYVSKWTSWGLCKIGYPSETQLNPLRPRQNGRHFPGDIFKWNFLNENVSVSIRIPLKFVPKGPIHNIPALVQIMAWRWPGDKSFSEPMMVSLLTHISVTRPQWVSSRTISFVHDWIIYFRIVRIFSQSRSVILPCSMQNFKAIKQIKWVLWTNEISWNLPAIKMSFRGYRNST